MLEVAKKYIVAYPKEKELELLNLMKKGFEFEIINEEEKEEDMQKDIQDIDYKISSLEFTINYLTPLAHSPSFFEKLKNPKIEIKKENLEKEIEGTEAMVEETVKIEEDIKTIEKENKDTLEKIKTIKDFRGTGVVPRKGIYTDNLFIRVKDNEILGVLSFCSKNEIFSKVLSKNSGSTLILLIFEKEDKEKILEKAEETGSEIVSYDFDKAPEEKIRELEINIEENNKKLEELNSRSEELAKGMRKLKIYYDFLQIKRSELTIKKEGLEREALNYVVFWAEKQEEDRFENEAKKISKEIETLEVVPKEGQKAPVRIKNNKAVEPFESVTEIFGLPRKDELDPTPYLSIFFFIFFGICITDAGYGLIMILMTAFALIFLKKAMNDTKLIKLLLYGGVSTFLIGLLFGGYFGVEVSKLGVPFLEKLRAIDPIKDTVLFMGLTFLFGYIQVSFSQIVRIIKGRKNKDRQEIISAATWLLFFVSSGAAILSIIAPPFKTLGFIGLIISGVGLLVVESKGTKIFLRPLVGAINILQGLINTISDILSYSRLMALGLATAVIALIVNQIAILFGSMIPYVGWLLTGAILVGGHLFNLGINALSGFIHSGRLQYVEFFPKFLEGGGRRLKSINPKLKYVEIN